MPIYAYRCEACGFAKDFLQKISDLPLSQCPECDEGVLHKQVTAAGFQLKGSGWYATDFRGGASSNSTNTDEVANVGGATAAGAELEVSSTCSAGDVSASSSISGSSSCTDGCVSLSSND
ncbi:FmdB family zinc ribbon protein [Candidatus Pandoraea novymonadis]|uniref:Putative regulatory protein FmdB zinc ribbon domain-containing protein n=1 Tax=Candidatus Pandoraea novymonadis TaxID=1808959 RepID=A0ABX5FF48_9BURK|nr:FmdB family zinc ribbon protein [Candidatus Pandoraea novymonadis]PSB92328.1 hypothetical protein BZL35_00568 [Candidatus Pandoraea novymonadis]